MAAASHLLAMLGLFTSRCIAQKVVACRSATTVSLDVMWPAPLAANETADLFEVQVSMKGAPPFASTTSTSTNATLRDLMPDTTYSVAVRARHAASRLWTSVSSASDCATSPLAANMLHLLPPTTQPAATSVELKVEPDPPPGTLEVTYRLVGSRTEWLTQRLAGPPYLLTGLQVDTAYEVRAALADVAGPPSDVTVHRTASTVWGFLDAFRISEQCGDACQSDFLCMLACLRTQLGAHPTGTPSVMTG